MRGTIHTGKGTEIVAFSLTAILVAGMLAAPSTPGAFATAEPAPTEILSRMQDTYRAMETYSAKGYSTVETSQTAAAFTAKSDYSITLKKPHFFNIFWSSTANMMSGMKKEGRVWNDGTTPSLYMNMMGMKSSYMEFRDLPTALAAATGVSQGAAFGHPVRHFFPFLDDLNVHTSAVKNLSRLPDEEVRGQPCFVIQYATKTHGMGEVVMEEVLWISKASSTILKARNTMHTGDMPAVEFSDSEVDKLMESAVRLTGENIAKRDKDEMVRQMRKSMRDAQKALASDPMHIVTEEHIKEVATPELSEADFKFVPPPDATLDDSFGQLLKPDN